METTIINLYGGPGVGKSTLAPKLFAALREKGLSAELVTEYAKELVWFERHAELADQLSIFAQQHRRVLRVYGKVAYIVTDSPLMNSVVYQPSGYPPAFTEVVRQFDGQFTQQRNYLLERKYPYESAGRLHNESQALDVDQEVETLLGMHQIDYVKVPNWTDPFKFICQDLFPSVTQPLGKPWIIPEERLASIPVPGEIGFETASGRVRKLPDGWWDQIRLKVAESETARMRQWVEAAHLDGTLSDSRPSS